MTKFCWQFWQIRFSESGILLRIASGPQRSKFLFRPPPFGIYGNINPCVQGIGNFIEKRQTGVIGSGLQPRNRGLFSANPFRKLPLAEALTEPPIYQKRYYGKLRPQLLVGFPNFRIFKQTFFNLRITFHNVSSITYMLLVVKHF